MYSMIYFEVFDRSRGWIAVVATKAVKQRVEKRSSLVGRRGLGS